MADITEIRAEDYTLEDFTEGTAPYLEIFSMYAENEFMEAQAVNRMDSIARAAGYKTFKTTYKKFKAQYQAEKTAEASQASGSISTNKTRFTGQPGTISCGEWVADDQGVRGVSSTSRLPVVACPHPIMPFRRLVNVDSKIIKIDIRYKTNHSDWQSLIVDRDIIASSVNIIKPLAQVGICVSSENAKDLVRYFMDCEAASTSEEIQTVSSVSRMGYIDQLGFSPYCEKLVFDGEANYRKIFDSVHAAGDPEVWKSEMLKVRKNISARLVIDAAFASIVLKRLGMLPFCVHLWSVESGTGKTVALMCAASVWADPSEGQYIQTWNSTQVGRERYGALLNNLPMIFDELQLDKAKGSAEKLYELTQGVGRTRGSRTGMDSTASWCCCIISSGESPITNSKQGAGALNRAIEIECSEDRKLIDDGHATSEIVKANYGHAGREWIQALANDDAKILDTIRMLYEEFFKTAIEAGITDKQALSGAVLYGVDFAVNQIIFDGQEPLLDDQDVLRIMKRKDEVDINQRAFDYLLGWIAENSPRFQMYNGENPGGFTIYGRSYGDSIIINKKIFDDAMTAGGFAPKPLIRWLERQDMIVKDNRGRSTYSQWLNGSHCNCVQIKTVLDNERLQTSTNGFENVDE